jgi:hypothetical protein
LWNNVDGVDEVRFVPFIESNKSNTRALLDQFSEMTGIAFRPDWVKPVPRKSNRSLSVEGVAFLRAINPHLPRITSEGRSNRPFRGRVVERIMDLTPGPTFNPADDIIEHVHQHFLASNRAVIDKLPTNPDWGKWLAQPTHDDKPQALVPSLTAARTADLMIALSQPTGPVAWGEKDKRPIRPVPLRRIAKQKVRSGLQKVTKLK